MKDRNRREFCCFIYKETGIYLSNGNSCCNDAGIYLSKGFLGMNIACPKRVVWDGVMRLKKSILGYTKWVVSQC